MTVERAIAHSVAKPWGALSLAPWSRLDPAGERVGEIWFDRPGPTALAPDLRLKLLFTTAPLSIQVHPDDNLAQNLGFARGKSEAWVILAAAPGAVVGLGLTARLDRTSLSAALADGSIADRLDWVPVAVGDALAVPAGTIHAIGAGLVLAEIQQASDVTFRLYDHGSDRPLQIAHAMMAAEPGPAARQTPPRVLDARRTELVACPQFVFERISLTPGTQQTLNPPAEAWLMVLEGRLCLDGLAFRTGEVACLTRGAVALAASGVVTALIAYPGPRALADLLTDPVRQAKTPPAQPDIAQWARA